MRRRPPPETSPTRSLLRLALRSGGRPGLLGWPGRVLGRTWGAPLDCGLHALIADPREAIQGEIIRRGGYERNLARVIRRVLRRRGGLFYDVGANIGTHTLTAASTGARVVAFEPVPRIADHLERTLRRNRLSRRVRVERCAVGEATTTATLYVSKRLDDGSHSLVAGVPAESQEAIRVSVVSLDDFARGAGLGAPDLVKIDVEGYEARVLDGARGLLRSARPPFVLVETADRLADVIGESGASVLDRLFDAGYSVFRVPEDGTATVAVRRGDEAGALANYLAVPPGPPP